MVRMGLPLFALLSIPISLIINSTFKKYKIRNIIYLFLFVFCLSSLLNSLKKNVDKYTIVGGINNNIQFFKENTENTIYPHVGIKAIDFINNNTPINSKVLFWPNNGFYLDRDYLYVIGFITSMADIKAIYNPNTVLEELKRFGITHVAMTDNYLRRRLKDSIIKNGNIKILYEDEKMIVASIGEL